jgi:U3 small nucleolar RNA-associated protein MPP10
MNDDQIWEQLDLRAKRLCETLEESLEGTNHELEDNEDGILEGKDLKKVLIDGEGGLEELDGIDWDVEERMEDDDSEDDKVEDEESDSDGHDEHLGEDITEELRDPSSEDDDDDERPLLLDLPGEKAKKSKRSTGGHAELDDGFFDLASFNAEADEGEAKSVSKGRLGEDEEEDSDGDMSVDLFAPVDDAENFEEEDLEDPGAGMNAGIYNDLDNTDNLNLDRTVLHRLFRPSSTGARSQAER